MRPTVIDVSPVQDVGGEEPGLLPELLGVLKQRKWWILSMAVLGLLIGFSVFIVRPRLYYAATTLELMGINEGFMGLGAVDPQAGTGNYSATGINIATQLRILESSSLRAAVLERLDRELTPIADPQPDIFTRFRSKLGLGNNDPLKSMQQGIQEANFSLKVRSVPQTRIISIQCNSTNPEIAATFVNTMAAEYISQSLSARSTTVQRTIQWLSGQMEETRVRLEQSEKKLQEFVQQSGNMYVADQEPLSTSKLRQLQGELSTIQADRIAKQARYELAMKSSPDALPDALDDGTLKGYRDQLAGLKREMAALLTTYTPQHDKVKRVVAQINEIEATQKRERENLIRKVTSEYEQAKNRERLLANAYAAQGSVVSSQSSKAMEYQMLKREVETLRLSLNTMLQQVNQANVASAVPTSNVRVVDSARAFNEPVEPTLPSHLAYGFGGGGAIGLALFVLIDKVRKHKEKRMVSMPGQAQSLMQVQELGVVPCALPREHWLKVRRKKSGTADALQPVNGDGADLALAGWRDRASTLAESFRFILASIKFLGWGGKPIQTMVITSPLPGEGKTTVASNLAAAMADSGKNILLIDGDLRKPRVHTVFGLAEGPGLYELLKTEADLTPNDLRVHIQETEVPGVSVLSAGCAELEEINRLLHSSRLTELLGYARQSYSMVLIDAPPLHQFPDARLMGGMADGAILVIRAGVTERESAVAAKERLAHDGVRLIGTVLNDWQPDERSAKYGRYYSYYRQDKA